MDHNKVDGIFRYPIRGLGTLVIFICLGPVIQAIVAVCLKLDVPQGSAMISELWNAIFTKILPAIIPSYSEYLPGPLLTGIWAGLITAKGLPLTLKGSIGRAVVMTLLVEIFISAIANLAGGAIAADVLVRNLINTGVEAIVVGWCCWSLSTIFRLDKTANQAR